MSGHGTKVVVRCGEFEPRFGQSPTASHPLPLLPLLLFIVLGANRPVLYSCSHVENPTAVKTDPVPLTNVTSCLVSVVAAGLNPK